MAESGTQAGCFWCGRINTELQEDHVFPRSIGGTKELCVPSCGICQTSISKAEKELSRKSAYAMHLLEAGPRGRRSRKDPASGFIEAQWILGCLNAHRFSPALFRLQRKQQIAESLNFDRITDYTELTNIGIPTVAVGTTIADRPPRRSVRARLRIRLLPRISSGKAGIRIRIGMLLAAHRAVPGTCVSRSESGACEIERCSPWSVPFPPQPPRKNRPSLFGWFTGTTAQSDFSCTYTSAVRFMAFADRS